jgi:hypothetical protein
MLAWAKKGLANIVAPILDNFQPPKNGMCP